MTLKSEQVAVGQTAVRVLQAHNDALHVNLYYDSDVIYLGGPDVTTSNGLYFPKQVIHDVVVPAKEELWAVSDGDNGLLTMLYQKN